MLAVLLAIVLVLRGQAQPETLLETYPDGKPRVERTVLRDASGKPIDHGPYESFHPNGKRESKGSYENGRRSGEWEQRWPDGKMRARGSYRDGLEQGSWTFFHEGGQKHCLGNFKAGARTGKWTYWTADGEPDELRSGVYKAVAETYPNGVVRWTGETLGDAKTGRWIRRWPNGARQLVAIFDVGRLRELYFFHRDDGLDPDWVTRATHAPPEWLAGFATAALLPVEPWPASEDSARVLETFLASAGTEEDLLVLAPRGRELVPATLNALASADLARPEGLERARRLHELLRALFGGHAWPWSAEMAPLLVQRWQSAWSLLETDEEAWSLDFHPDWSWLELRFEQTALAIPELPEGLGPTPALSELGGGASGKFGTRLLGDPYAPFAKSIAPGLKWLLRQQSPDGAWRDSQAGAESDVLLTALALHVLLGEGNTLARGEQRAELRSGLRALLARQSRADGSFGALRGHAVATWVLMVFTYRSDSDGLRRHAQRALDALLQQQSRDGGFGSEPVASALATLAFSLADDARLEFDPAAFERARAALLTRASGLTTEGARAPWSTAIVGAAMLTALDSGLSFDDPSVAPLATWLGANPMRPDEPLLGSMLGTWAAFRLGKAEWKAWYQALRASPRVVAAEKGALPCAASSFEPAGGQEAMALVLLTLQVFYQQ